MFVLTLFDLVCLSSRFMNLVGLELKDKNYMDYPKRIYMDYYLRLLAFLSQNEFIYDVGLSFYEDLIKLSE
jgi:hypothetical protein